MTQAIFPADGRMEWSGAISIECTADFVQAWRIDHARRALFPGVAHRAAMAAGVRLRFASDTRLVAGTIVPPHEPDRSPIDLVIEGRDVASQATKGASTFEFRDLPAGMKQIELHLPQFGQFRLRELRLDRDAHIERSSPESGRRWITHGSSITECRSASRPLSAWPTRVARSAGLNLLNLGFGGQCHLDGLVAKLIRDQPADCISLCFGINMHAGSVGERAFVPGILSFVQTIRERHPITPIAVISPIISPPREQEPSRVGWTLPKMRQAVGHAVDLLRAAGDAKLAYIDGLDLLGAAESHLLPDQLHPNDEGYAILAERFEQRVVREVFDAMR